MGGFIASRSLATRHAVYAEERTPPAVIQAIDTGVVGLVGQFPWGPDDEVVQPVDVATRGRTFAPFGMSRLGTGWLATLWKGWPDLRIVRVTGSTAAKATATIQDTTGPTDIIVVTLKYKGAEGNNVDWTISAPSDGDANHFKLTVHVTGPSGYTEDVFDNLNYSGTGSDSTPTFTDTILVGGITKSNAGRPTNGTGDFSGGLDGTINSARYIGTPSAGDFGMALFENDKQIRTVFADDPGDSDRAAVNAGLSAHVSLMGERVAVIKGDSGLTLSAAQTDVANYRSKRIVFADPWGYIYDDTDGSEQLVPLDSFVASVIAQTSPSTSIAWKSPTVIEMLRGIIRLETPRGNGAGSNTLQGIATVIKEDEGGHSIEAGVLTIAPSDPSVQNLTRTRMGDYIATSVTRSLRRAVDAPNVPLNQQDVVNAIDRFLEGLKKEKDRAPNTNPYINDYAILPLAAANPQAELDAGDFTVPADIKIGSSMSRIFFSIRFGENVQITAQAA